MYVGRSWICFCSLYEGKSKLKGNFAFQCIWSNGPQICRLHQNKMFSVGPKVIFAPHISMTGANFRCWFPSLSRICCLICFLKPARYSRSPPRTPIITTSPPQPLESFSPFVNFLLTSAVITILHCYSCVNFTSFHILWPQKSYHRFLLFFGAFY